MKVELAYLCIERRQYSTAVAILESMRIARPNESRRPWGYALRVLPAVVADEYRARLGNPRSKIDAF